jgi:hypothetical protein
MAPRNDEVLGLLRAQLGLLKSIAAELAKLNSSKAPLSPGYRRRLSEYPSFDWTSIGAQVVAQDRQGVSEVEWSGHRFDRRQGDKFGGKFIIFSRPADKNGDTQKYHTLIRFADYNTTSLIQPEEAKPRQAKTVTQAQPKAQASNGQPADENNGRDAFYAYAARLVNARQCTVGEYDIMSKGPGTWAERAARLLAEYGPLPEKGG